MAVYLMQKGMDPLAENYFEKTPVDDLPLSLAKVTSIPCPSPCPSSLIPLPFVLPLILSTVGPLCVISPPNDYGTQPHIAGEQGPYLGSGQS